MLIAFRMMKACIYRTHSKATIVLKRKCFTLTCVTRLPESERVVLFNGMFDVHLRTHSIILTTTFYNTVDLTIDALTPPKDDFSHFACIRCVYLVFHAPPGSLVRSQILVLESLDRRHRRMTD